MLPTPWHTSHFTPYFSKLLRWSVARPPKSLRVFWRLMLPFGTWSSLVSLRIFAPISSCRKLWMQNWHYICNLQLSNLWGDFMQAATRTERRPYFQPDMENSTISSGIMDRWVLSNLMSWSLVEPVLASHYIRYFEIVQVEYRLWYELLVVVIGCCLAMLFFLTPGHNLAWKEFEGRFHINQGIESIHN